MEFTIDLPNLSALLAALQQAPSIAAPILQRALSASSLILAQKTPGNVPRRTGFLEKSFRADITAGVLRWYPTASYARDVEFGTGPHVILPKNKKALYWPGASHPVRKVNHPGTKANPYMERILAASQEDIISTFATALGQITSAIASQS